MKNKAGFKVGDKVGYLVPAAGGLESLRGLTGTIRYVDDIGAEVVFKTTNGKKVYTLANCDMIKVNNTPITTAPTTPREIANDKNNVWAIVIEPSPYNREITWANLYINGRNAMKFSVSRWCNEDKYDVGIAAYEVVKKMFNIKDKKTEKVADNETTPKYFNGRVVCLKESMLFTTGKIYDVVNGTLTNDFGSKLYCFTDVDDINNKTNAQFIEVVERMDNTTTKEPEWFTGKIVCTYSDSGEFTEGKIYRVNHGVLFNNDNFKYGNFKSVENINKRLYSQFIEVVE